MKTNLLRLIALMLLYPYLTGFTPDSTGSENSIFVFLSGGGGNLQRIAYGCSGERAHSVVPFTDYGAGAEVNLQGLILGARAGGYQVNSYTAVMKDENNVEVGRRFYTESKGTYTNLYGGFTSRYASLTAGGIFVNEQMSKVTGYDAPSGEEPVVSQANTWQARLRLGNEQGLFASGELLSSSPIFSGGGVVNLGAGVCVNPVSETKIWFGLGLIDFENGAPILKISSRVYNDYYGTLTGGFSGRRETSFISLTVGRKFSF